MPTATAFDTATAALEAAGQLAGVAWDQVEGPEAVATAAMLARLRALVDGALVAVTGRIEATGASDVAGWASSKNLITHLLGGRKGTGGGLLRVAERTADLPAVRPTIRRPLWTPPPPTDDTPVQLLTSQPTTTTPRRLRSGGAESPGGGGV